MAQFADSSILPTTEHVGLAMNSVTVTDFSSSLTGCFCNRFFTEVDIGLLRQIFHRIGHCVTATCFSPL